MASFFFIAMDYKRTYRAPSIFATTLSRDRAKLPYMGRVETIGDRIRRCRSEAGLTQEQLASRVGIKAAAVGQWEIGRTRPNYHNLTKVAAALGKSPEWLHTGHGHERAASELEDTAQLLTTEVQRGLIDYLSLIGSAANAFHAEQDAAEYRARIERLKKNLLQRRG